MSRASARTSRVRFFAAAPRFVPAALLFRAAARFSAAALFLAAVLFSAAALCSAAALGSAAALAVPCAAMATTTTAAAPASSLATALDSINADNLRTDLVFVASDEQAGRDTPSEGQRVVARFISARMERLGWEPAAPQGWFYTYPLDQRTLDEAESHLAWQCEGKKGTFRLGEDYFLTSSRDVRASQLRGKVAFAGRGTEEDFDDKALEDRWALCFDAGESTRTLRERARKAQCIGLIVAPGPDYSGAPYPQRFKADLQRVRDGLVSFPGKDRSGRGGDRERSMGTPVVMLTREAVTTLLSAAKEPETPRLGAQIADLTDTRVVAEGTVDCENVCALWPGSDPQLGRETILITAHYDHIGMEGGQVNNGADDNGSGTVGLMALAEALTKTGPMRRSVMLMWVSGEEKGLWGSKAWTQAPFLPDGRKAICNINMDMIGRNAPDQLLVTPTKKLAKEYNGLVRLAEKLAPLEGFPVLGNADDVYQRSDHINFARMGMPVAFLFSGLHEDYHQPGDDVEKVDCDKVRRVMRLVLRVVDGLQADKLDLK